MEYKDFKLGKYQYITTRDYPILIRIVWFMVLPGFRVQLPPLCRIVNGKRRYREKIGLNELCSAIGFTDPALIKVILIHNERLGFFGNSLLIIRLVILLSIFGIIVVLYLWGKGVFMPPQTGFPPESINLMGTLKGLPMSLIESFVLCLTLIISCRLIFKIMHILTNSYFADTFCIEQILYLIIELSRDDILSDPFKRKLLVERINDLANNTSLLFLRFKFKKESDRELVRERFRYIENYIRERGQWAITPMSTTLYDLQKDFYALAKIFILSSYGEFKWPEASLQPEPVKQTRLRRGLTAAPRVIGFILPFIFLGFVIWKHDWLETKGIGTNVITLIFVSWLLLAIDATLKLGVVAGIANLAKEIKNLKE